MWNQHLFPTIAAPNWTLIQRPTSKQLKSSPFVIMMSQSEGVGNILDLSESAKNIRRESDSCSAHFAGRRDWRLGELGA